MPTSCRNQVKYICSKHCLIKFNEFRAHISTLSFVRKLNHGQKCKYIIFLFSSHQMKIYLLNLL